VLGSPNPSPSWLPLSITSTGATTTLSIPRWMARCCLFKFNSRCSPTRWGPCWGPGWVYARPTFNTRFRNSTCFSSCVDFLHGFTQPRQRLVGWRWVELDDVWRVLDDVYWTWMPCDDVYSSKPLFFSVLSVSFEYTTTMIFLCLTGIPRTVCPCV
jgi:hypothetical protein